MLKVLDVKREIYNQGACCKSMVVVRRFGEEMMAKTFSVDHKCKTFTAILALEKICVGFNLVPNGLPIRHEV